MPSSISFNGVRTFRPGVYAVIDASALGGSGVSTGNVAVVGDFSMLQQSTPKVFSSARAMSDYFLGDADMQLLAKIAFSPAADDRIGGGAAKLTLVNSAAVGQAQHVFLDASASASLLVKSKLHGKAGNKVSMDIAQNANGTAFDMSVRYNGSVEAFTGIESGVLFTAQFSGTGTSSLAVTPSAVTLTEGFTTSNGTASESVDCVFSLPAARNIKITPSASYANVHNITVAGTLADGSAHSEVVPMPADGTSVLTTAAFKTVATCEAAARTAGESSQFTFSAELLAMNTADFASVAQMADALDAVPNVAVVKVAPNLGGIPANELDAKTAALNGAVGFRADLHALIQALKSSQIVVGSRATGATKKPALASGAILMGGTQASPTTAGYTAALATLLSEDVQIVTALDEAIATHKEVLQHCKDAQLYGRERNGYAGAPANTSLATLFSDYSSKLNSRHMALVGQSIKYSMPNGTLKTLSPKYFALMVACMQAGSEVSTPLTRKRPDVLGSEQHAEWNVVASANDAIQKGILALSLDNLGLRIERSVTTYMTDDNPIYSEVSANESVNTSVRTLRSRLDGQIGNPAIAGTRAKIESAVRINLAKQVKDGVIKAFQNVVIQDLGDRFDIAYEVAAIEPLNFIKITANVVRIPG